MKIVQSNLKAVLLIIAALLVAGVAQASLEVTDVDTGRTVVMTPKAFVVNVLKTNSRTIKLVNNDTWVRQHLSNVDVQWQIMFQKWSAQQEQAQFIAAFSGCSPYIFGLKYCKIKNVATGQVVCIQYSDINAELINKYAQKTIAAKNGMSFTKKALLVTAVVAAGAVGYQKFVDDTFLDKVADSLRNASETVSNKVTDSLRDAPETVRNVAETARKHCVKAWNSIFKK
jgi:hypothetical protein